MEVVAPSSAPMLVMVARSGTLRVAAPLAAVLDDFAYPALHGHAAQDLEDHVFGGNPVPTVCR